MIKSKQQALLLDQLAESTGDYYFYYDCAERRAWFSANGRRAFAAFISKDGCTFQEWCELLDPADLPKFLEGWEEMLRGGPKIFEIDYRTRCRCGRTVWVNSRCRCYLDQKGLPGYVLGRISERPVLARTIEGYHQAALAQELGRLCSTGQKGFLLLVGIDDMHRINLKYGREYGDEIIRSLAENMARHVQSLHQIFRVNGDCFGVVLPGYSREKAETFFALLQQGGEERYTLSGGAVSLQEQEKADPALLIQYAESSLAIAKETGKNHLCFFSPADYHRSLETLELQEELAEAVKHGFAGFSLWYQAQVRAGSHELFGAEALLRFDSPRRGRVSPGEFIPLLERSGLICPVGMWVIQQVLAQCREWRKAMPGLHISVNMSYLQLACREIGPDLLRVLHSSGLPGEALTIEVTESQELLDYPHLNEIFRLWKREGISLSVDDFGTGYSSLRRLKELEVDEIKMDQCFARGLQAGSYNHRLVGNMIELAESCGIRTCCEGVERPEELVALEMLRPTLYQGFFFSEPCPPEAFAARFLPQSTLETGR